MAAQGSGQVPPHFHLGQLRQVNAQTVILRDTSAGAGAGVEALLQLRSHAMQVMPGHLGAIGGQRDAADPDSWTTAWREVREECGLTGGVVLPPCMFAAGQKCDWFVMKVQQPTFANADTPWEVADVRTILHLLPPSSSVADCFGHAWVPVRDLHLVDESKLPLMGGLRNRVYAGAKHLQHLEASHPEWICSVEPASSLDADGVAEQSAAASPDVLEALKTQIEYYLSDQNLQRDKFFHEAISASGEGWLSLDVVMRCKRVQSTGASLADVVAALHGSEVEVRSDGVAIRRLGNRPLPSLQAKKEPRTLPQQPTRGVRPDFASSEGQS